MAITIKLRRATAAQWTSANSVLALGEAGVETDTRKFKFGDGATAWNSLGYGEAPVSLPIASETTAGIIEIATDAEAAAGTATNLAINPKQLAAAIDSVEITEIDGGGA